MPHQGARWQLNMEPQRNTNATLVDLLDRVLDKGLVIQADLIVSVAGVPLIGVNLRAALAGMETMLKYGVMQAWDDRSRAWERENRSEKENSPVRGEDIILKMLGAYHSEEGIYTAWRYGYICLTGKFLLLYHGGFEKVLFKTPLENIMGLTIRTGEKFSGEEREELCLLLAGGKTVRLSALNVGRLKGAIEKRMKECGLVLETDWAFPIVEESTESFLTVGERVISGGKMWCLMETDGIIEDTWKPGHLYLTDKKLCWWYDFERKIVLEIPVENLVASAVEIRDLSGFLKKKKVMDVLYSVNGAKDVASFSGGALEEWDKILDTIVSRERVVASVQ